MTPEPTLSDTERDLVEANLGLISVALRHHPVLVRMVGWDEAFQLGFMYLVRALRTFKPEKGFELSTHMTAAVSLRLRRDFHRALADRKMLSLDWVYTNPDGSDDPFMMRCLTDDTAPSGQETAELQGTVRTILDSLSHNDRAILAARFGLDGRREMSSEEIAQKISVTRNAINLRLGRIAAKIRRRFGFLLPPGPLPWGVLRMRDKDRHGPGAHDKRGPCLECGKSRKHRPRGLCHKCYKDPAIREKYPVSKYSNKPKMERL